ncbi:MAG: histidinol-phosphate transaminase [Nitrospirota bacterium]
MRSENWKVKNLIRKEVLRLKAYTVENAKCRIKLDAHEIPYSLPDELRSKVVNALNRVLLNRYPDPESKVLREIISRQLKVNIDNIVLGNGSDELIQYLIAVFGNSPGKVLYPVPSFAMYNITSRALGQIPVEVRLDKDFDIPIKNFMLTVKQEKPHLIFLSYPNNPTGNCFSGDKIIRIIEESKAAVVIDEAYYDFSKKSFLSYLKNYKNLIILRTLSKIGLAGLRVGILITHPEIVTEINKVRLPYNINSLSQAAAITVLKNRHIINRQVNAIINERKRLYEALLKIKGIKPFPSEGNFILFRGSNSDAIYRGLFKKGILIKNLSKPGALKGCLRVTVGRPEENEAFIKALRKLV